MTVNNENRRGLREPFISEQTTSERKRGRKKSRNI